MMIFLPSSEEIRTVSIKLHFERDHDPSLDSDEDIESCEIHYLVTNKQDYLNALSVHKLLPWGAEFSESTEQEIWDYEQKIGLKRQDSLSPEREIIPAYQLKSYHEAGKTCKHFDNGKPFNLYDLAHSYHFNYSGQLSAACRVENGMEVPLEEQQKNEFLIRREHKDNIESMLTAYPISYVSTSLLRAAQSKGQSNKL